MATPARRAYTLEDYEAIELGSPFRHEYVRGEIFAMAGGKPRHNEVASNVHGAFWQAFTEGPCAPVGSDQRLRVSESEYVYADVTLFCEAIVVAPSPPPDTATNPTVVVEVLSDSTRGYDTVDKLQMYRSMPTVRAIWLVEPDRTEVTAWSRGADGAWSASRHVELDDEVPVLDRSVPMARIYGRRLT